MKSQQIDYINEKIHEHYLDIKKLLLDSNNYLSKAATQNVRLYFNFLEASLNQPYNRINAVFSFIVGNDGQLRDKMYPFAFLKDQTMEAIDKNFAQAIGFVDRLEGSDIDSEFKSLCEEQLLLKVSA